MNSKDDPDMIIFTNYYNNSIVSPFTVTEVNDNIECF